MVAMFAVIALGIDPGTRLLGWGVVARDGNRMRHVAHGVLKLGSEAALPIRLQGIADGLNEVIRRFEPDVASVESIFFHKDPQAAAKLGHARGVVLLSMAQAGLEVAEYPPARVKRTITGRGQAEKKQVAMMIRALLSLDKVPPADAADALALAVTRLRIGVIAEHLLPEALRKQARERRRALAVR